MSLYFGRGRNGTATTASFKLYFGKTSTDKSYIVLYRILMTFWRDEDGQDLIEYALLMAFIALAAVAVLSNVKTNVTKLWNSISNALSNAVTTAG